MSDAWIKKLWRAAVRWCHRADSPAPGVPTALDTSQGPLCPRELPFGDNSFLSSTLLRNSQHSKGINECVWQSTSNQGICSLLSKAACQWFLSERLMVQVIRTVMDISNDQLASALFPSLNVQQFVLPAGRSLHFSGLFCKNSFCVKEADVLYLTCTPTVSPQAQRFRTALV